MNDNKKDYILFGFVEGNEAIIAQFYKENLPKIVAFVKRNSGNAADGKDVFQDAMVFTFQKIKKGDLHLECSLGTFVYAVSKNIWRNKLRKKGKFLVKEDDLGLIMDNGPTITDFIQMKEQEYLFQKHLLNLDKSCLEVLMYFFSGASINEIAEKFGYTKDYAKKKKFLCKKNLIEKIEADASFRDLINRTK